MQHLLRQFSSALSWNAALYALYKASTTIFSWTLFMRLTTYDYATWANVHALTFLAILWLDFGLRKSIPRFCPEFARHPSTHQSFIRTIITLQSLLLIIATPVFIYGASTTAHTLSLDRNLWLFYSAAALFISEGLISVLRTLYHAHFWNASFNTVSIAIITLEMIGNGLLLVLCTDSNQLLTWAIILKIVMGFVTIIVCLALLKRMYQLQQYEGDVDERIDTRALTKSFVKHSGIMWINTNIKSVSERNFLVPVITYTLGHASANLFKVANDGALLVYRMVIKTIGSNDTALLAHANSSINKQESMDVAFKKLATKIAGLCFPLLGIVLLLGACSSHIIKDHDVFRIFFIITISYLIEALLSPYERMLEVHAHYKALVYAYVPYIIMMFILYSFNFLTFIGLVNTILLIQGVRLVSSLIMAYYAHRSCNITLPMRSFYNVAWYCGIVGIPVCVILYYVCSYVVKYTWVGVYVIRIFPTLSSIIY